MSNWTFIAQRATTGEILDFEVPVDVDELAWGLSGGDSFKGAVTPETFYAKAADGRPVLEEWGTLLYAESGGEIRWGGIVVNAKYEGAKFTVEAADFAAYPHGIPYGGTYSRIGVDPAEVVRHLWEHVQSYPDGDLGVTVSGSTDVRIGTEPRDVEFVTGDGESVAFEAGPYTLAWQDAPDVGEEIESLAKETPFDFVTRHRWDGEEIRHEVEIAYPRLGRRRTDLAFVQGDNVTNVVQVDSDGDDFANEVIGLGAGEGSGALRRTTSVRDGRLRRPYVYTAKDVTSASRLDSLIARERRRRSNLLAISSVDVVDHANAPIGSWSLGDDVRVDATIPFLGDVSVWSRIVGWSLIGEDRARLSLARSDSFTYGG